MKYAIITGTSRGLGEALATLFLKSKTPVIGISRNKNEKLVNLATAYETNYEHIVCDLTEKGELQTTLGQIKAIMKQPKEILLIHNAAMVEPIHQASELDAEDLSDHMQINVTAPMVMTSSLLQFAMSEHIPLTVVIITSGAAERAVYGWSAYCSSKAAMNMYTKTVALEQSELKTNNKIIAFSPGIMDTEMQKQIRSHSYEEFIEMETFKNYKQTNQLQNPLDIAGIIKQIVSNREEIESGKIYYARDYL